MDATDSRIFISYRRDDTAGHAGRLADDLTDLFGPEQIFFDLATIAPGQNFVRAIDQAVEQATAVIVVIGPQWATISDGAARRLDSTDDYVRLEVGAALAKQKPLLPVLVDRARMPSRSELPEELAELAQYNALELTDSRWGYDFGRLIDALEQAGVSAQPFESFPEFAEPARSELRDAWLAPGDEPRVRERVEAFARAKRMRSNGWSGSMLELEAGSLASARLLGGFFVRESKLPRKAKIRLNSRGAKVQVEALVFENLGPGSFAGMASRYDAAFEKWMTELRRATGAASR